MAACRAHCGSSMVANILFVSDDLRAFAVSYAATVPPTAAHLHVNHSLELCLAHVLQQRKACHARRMCKVLNVGQLVCCPGQQARHGSRIC